MRTWKQCLAALSFLLPIIGFAQVSVSGTVTEAGTGTPLPGVNVIVKGTTNGVATDFDGNYQITANQGDVLTFSYIGFVDQEVTVSGTTINVALEESSSELDEVVVIGYGTTTVRDATGSVTAITTQDFAKGNIATAENLINGRAAGVTVNTSGAPGSGSVIRIRGGASLTASNDPLIVIDGLPITNQTAGGSRSILAAINPADIDSFSILKDASATAIYGSRASNGVIIITTKKGRKSLNVEYTSTVAFETLADEIDVFSADEFRQLVTGRFPDRTSLLDRLGNANTNWQDEIFRNATTFDNNLSVRGGLYKGALPVRLSLGVRNQPGTLETSKFNRYTLGLSVNPSMWEDHLKVNFNMNYTREENRFADTGQIGAALRYDPTQPVYDESSPFGGFFQFLNPDGTKPAQAPANPVATLLQTRNTGAVNRLFGNIEFDYKLHFFPDLRAVVQLGYDKSSGLGSNVVDRNSFNGFLTGEGINGQEENNFSTFDSFRENKQFYSYLAYSKEINDFDLEVTGGYDYQKFQESDLTSGNLRAPDNVSDFDTRIDVVLTSFFGRAQLDYKDKYLLTLTYRRDGSSRFIDDFRWGNFPSAAFAWQIGDEDFLKDSSTISNLKLRLGWGITGQQDIGVRNKNPFQNTFTVSENNTQYIFAGTPINTLSPDAFNRLLKWEETSQYNVGLDIGLFDNRVSATVDAFLKVSDDLLFNNAPVADGANFSNTVEQNIGQFTTKGLELSVNADVVRGQDFNWNVTFNGTMLDREIDELIDGSDIDVGGRAGGTGGTVQLFREGEAPNSFFVYQQLFDDNGVPIEGAFRDLNGDGIINTSDRYIRGNPDADLTLGFRSDINWRKFDFSFQLRASLGNEVYNNVNSANAYFNLLDGNGFPSNIPTSVNNTGFTTQDAFIINSDIYVEDGSFLRMDNVTLGYTFDNVFKIDASRLRFTAGVQNVFLITDYSGLDPEIPDATNPGIDNVIYPRSRTFLFGANFSL